MYHLIDHLLHLQQPSELIYMKPFMLVADLYMEVLLQSYLSFVFLQYYRRSLYIDDDFFCLLFLISIRLNFGYSDMVNPSIIPADHQAVVL